MKFIISLTVLVSFFVIAYRSAQLKTQTPVTLQAIQLGMSQKELEKNFGRPDAQLRGQLTFVLPDSSKLFVTFRDEVVASARLEYSHPLKIEDPKLKKLTLVQMDADTYYESEPSWFFAGKPEEGLIYKITSQGDIESLTWVPPFIYENNGPKNLQALLRNFKSKSSSNL